VLAEHAANPALRTAQQVLAEELTRMLHGDAGLADAKRATAALFSGDVKSLSAQLLDEVFRGAPSTSLDRGLLAGAGLSVVDLLTLADVAKSKREARQYLSSGAVSLNGERVSEEHHVGSADLLHERLVLIRRGKKTWHVCRFDQSA
jgi:tyrosyl-tRNA synthetase